MDVDDLMFVRWLRCPMIVLMRVKPAACSCSGLVRRLFLPDCGDDDAMRAVRCVHLVCMRYLSEGECSAGQS